MLGFYFWAFPVINLELVPVELFKDSAVNRLDLVRDALDCSSGLDGGH